MRHARRNSSPLRLEALETRDAPATLVSATKLTYQDIDGDNVTVTFSKPILNNGNLDAIFGAGFVRGNNTVKQHLTQIDLRGVGAGAGGVNITTSAVRDAVTGGDGFA